MRLLSLLAGGALLLAAGSALADPIVLATGGTRDEIQAAVDAVGSAGVVLIPPGQWAVVGSVAIGSDDITILGSGAAQTRLYHDSSNNDQTAAFFSAKSVTGLRIASLRLDGIADSGSSSSGIGVRVQDAVDFRVDHAVMSHSGLAGVAVYGTSQGVVDHDQMLSVYKPAIANLGYGVMVIGPSTYSGLPFGVADAVFIEDCQMREARHAAASNTGARYVFRHNVVTANIAGHAVDAHGDEYNGSSNFGTEWIEVYENLIEAPITLAPAVRIRGGTGVVWGNEINGHPVAVALWEQTPEPTGPVYIWNNTLGPGVSETGNTMGSPDYQLVPAPGYTPYAYPHPLVSDLDVQAGPDQVTAVEGATAAVYLDGSATSASTGSVVAHRWLEDGTTLRSSCARDIVALGEGTHLLLLEAERDDGKLEYDTTVVEVGPAGPLVSSDTWARRWFVPLVASGQVQLTVSPGQPAQDAYLALSGAHGIGGHGDAAIIIRTNQSGRFDARDGAAYAAVNDVPYLAGQSYQVAIDIDLAGQLYSATVDGVTIADGYAFRRAESEIAQLVGWHSAGSLELDALSVQGPRAQGDPPCDPNGGAGGGGGASSSGGSGGAAGGGSGATIPAAGESGGCGCRTAGGAERTGTGWLWLLLVGLRRGRRERGQRKERDGAALRGRTPRRRGARR